MKATIIDIFCILVAFSFKNKEEQIITKNGDNLLSIEASLTKR